jgi:hypothetical protein
MQVDGFIDRPTLSVIRRRRSGALNSRRMAGRRRPVAHQMIPKLAPHRGGEATDTPHFHSQQHAPVSPLNDGRQSSALRARGVPSAGVRSAPAGARVSHVHRHYFFAGDAISCSVLITARLTI